MHLPSKPLQAHMPLVLQAGIMNVRRLNAQGRTLLLRLLHALPGLGPGLEARLGGGLVGVRWGVHYVAADARGRLPPLQHLQHLPGASSWL